MSYLWVGCGFAFRFRPFGGFGCWLLGLLAGVLPWFAYLIVMIGSVSDDISFDAKDTLRVGVFCFRFRILVLGLGGMRFLYVSLGFRFVLERCLALMTWFMLRCDFNELVLYPRRDELESLILAQSERWRHA